MNVNHRVFALAAALVAITVPHRGLAVKPDWPVERGTGVIGFGLLEVQKPGRVTISYDLPHRQGSYVDGGQILVFPASSAKKFNDIATSELISYVSGRNHLAGTDFHLSASVQIAEAGLYFIAYGPWSGLLTFDTGTSTPVYKISAASEAGIPIRWVDQDAGDLTVLRISEGGWNESDHVILRIRLLRDLDRMLEDIPLQLHPTALERVRLLDANW